MKPALLFLAIAMVCSSAIAQTTIYKTYEDFVNGKGEKMDDEYIKTFESSFGMALRFKNTEGEIVKYKPKELWGFTYKGVFFRSVGGELAMLQDSGTISYYLNGYAGIGMLKNPGQTVGHYLAGESQCFLSVGDINAKIYKMALNPIQKRDYPKFKKDYPDFEDFYDCATNYYDYEIVRKCVQEFNNKQKKKKR